jgi:hypothetical protein
VPKHAVQAYGSFIRQALSKCPEEAEAYAKRLGDVTEGSWSNTTDIIPIDVIAFVTSFTPRPSLLSDYVSEYLSLRSVHHKPIKVAVDPFISLAGDRDVSRYTREDAKPAFIRSDNGPEFISLHLQDWLKRVGIQPLQIYPGSPWENGYDERFNGTLRREVLNAEWFHTTKQAQVAINAWLRQSNQIRPHHALNMKPPVPETLLEKTKISGTETWG